MILKSKNKYSKEYLLIKEEIENSWPNWKIASFNINFATSVHAKKILKRKQMGN